MDQTFLIVGLGNPGEKYLFTRHNIGFLALDWIHSRESSQDWKSEKKALVSKIKIGTATVLLAKPQTFMNLSGESVQSLMAFYKVPKENILVIQDDLAMPFGSLRFFYDRSPGGHNGIKDIHNKIGSQYARLKIGILSDMGNIPVDRFVLMNFAKEEQDKFPELLDTVQDSVFSFVQNGLTETSNRFNRKKGLL